MGKEASVGRVRPSVWAVLVRLQRRQRPVELAERGGDERPTLVIAGVRQGVAGGEIVRAVENDVETADDATRVVGPEPQGDRLDGDVRVEPGDRVRRALRLRP